MRLGVSGATSFPDRETANKAIKDALDKNSDKIVNWIKNSNLKRILLVTEHDFIVGYGIKSDTMEQVTDIKKTKVLLEKSDSNDLGFVLITSYPKID